MKQEEKLKALDAALVKIEKDYGKGSVMKLGEYQADRTIEVTPTGSISLDIALGVGGVPKGRIIEIYGPESSGKTTVALHMVAEVQKRGGQDLLMQSMPLIRSMQRISGLTLITFISLSQIQESRDLKSQRQW
jgi:protein RecA